MKDIIRVFKDATDNLGHPSYELSFYLLADKVAVKSRKPTISDVYIAQDQEVYPSFCNISSKGAIVSSRDINKNLDMRVAGWAHSHGNLRAFFSGTDIRTFDHFLEDYRMFGSLEFSHYGHSHIYEIEYTFGLVASAKETGIFSSVNTILPNYVVKEGDIYFTSRRERFDNIGISILGDLIENSSSIDSIDSIKKDLETRVCIGGKGKRIGEFLYN